MSSAVILTYNLESRQKLKLTFICAQLKIRCISVAKADYAQSVGALAGLQPRSNVVFQGEGFEDEMLVMSGFNNQLLHAFLNALRQDHMPGIALKAVITPTNAAWDSVRLHDEILKEHNAMHPKQGR